MSRARILAGALVLAALVPACSSGSASTSDHASVTVRPGTSDLDQPVQIRVAGLAGGQLTTVRVTSTDAEGTSWASADRYRATASGEINPAQAPPVSGSYQGVSATGPIWSMSTAGPVPLGAYAWPSGAQPLEFTVTVSVGGTTVASTSFQRRLTGIALASRAPKLQADGFIGEFVEPAQAVTRRPAILVLGGSEGGLPDRLLVAALASHGYPALGVAYFDEPSLPSSLSRIPLGYFAKALRWLASQPGVDPAKIAVLGISRGSEPYARAILARLDEYRDPWPHVLNAYPGTGHFLGDFLPDEPLGAASVASLGASANADQEALPSLWQHLLTFLAGFG